MGTCVEDIMYEASRKFIYEHPSHPFIFSVNDDIWKDYFSVEDLKEIKDSIEARKVCEDMPKHFVDALLKLNKKKTYKEMYDVFKNIEADRHDDPELYWVKESVLDYIELFYNTNFVKFNSEQDFLDEVYGFIKKSRRISKTRTETVTGSTASAETKNKTRSLGTMEMLRRQIPGDLADLSFLHKSTEIGCLEIGLSDKGSNGTKELQEKSLKTPRMMKAFIIQASSSFPTIDISKSIHTLLFSTHTQGVNFAVVPVHTPAEILLFRKSMDLYPWLAKLKTEKDWIKFCCLWSSQCNIGKNLYYKSPEHLRSYYNILQDRSAYHNSIIKNADTVREIRSMANPINRPDAISLDSLLPKEMLHNMYMSEPETVRDISAVGYLLFGK
ncbi:unnamed protein product [Mucor hiemalis]